MARTYITATGMTERLAEHVKRPNALTLLKFRWSRTARTGGRAGLGLKLSLGRAVRSV